MQVVRQVLVVALSAVFLSPAGARAQDQQVVDRDALDRAVAAHVQRADADRQRVLRTLERQEVRHVAARAGIDVEHLGSVVATLDDAELSRIAEQASAVDESLAGGQSRVTISTTTIIIGLLVLILLIVALK